MSVRQYIGARYVTKIYENSLDPSSAEWEPGVSYEPLTLVTYNNGSYLSKKEVPGSVGDPASNPPYWVQTGFYNGQIASLQAQIDTINATLTNLKNRKIVWIGDSYMEAAGLTPADSFARLVGNALGMVENTDYYISAQGGYAFARSGLQFITLLNNISVSDPDEITDVIVAGGANEGESVRADIIPAIEAFATASRTKFPNAKIHLAFVGWTMGNGYVYNDLINYWKQGAYTAGCAFVDGVWMCQHTYNLKQADGHPNANGQIQIAASLENYIETGHIAYPSLSFITTTITQDGDVTFTSPNMYSSIIDKNVCLRITGNIEMTLNTPLAQGAYGAGTPICIGTITSGAFVGNTIPNRRWIVSVLLIDSSNVAHTSSAFIFFNNNKMYITPVIAEAMTISKVYLPSNTYDASYYEA